MVEHTHVNNGLAIAAVVCLAISTATAQERQVTVSGGITAIEMEPNTDRIRGDRTLSGDLYIERPTQRGRWFAYVEGNSTLDQQAASTLLVEANADAGTALDPDRNGRIQLSELNYSWRQPNSRLTMGLIDPSSYLDRTRITNDENVQFLGVSFVNNPTIEFPDYTLGVAFERPKRGRMPEINVVISSSNGIADNPNLSYSQLIQISQDDKGVFAATGVAWQMQHFRVRLGAWLNSKPHETIQGGEPDASNSGMYGVFGWTWQRHGLSCRLGFADRDVTQGSEFLAVAYRIQLRSVAVGVGVARIFLSDKEIRPNLDDSTQVEAFARFNLTSRIHLTGSVQRLRNSGFNAGADDPLRSVSLGAIRFHWSFGS